MITSSPTPLHPDVPQRSDAGRVADVILSDGRIAVLRSPRLEDRPALYDLHDQVSDETVWLRFFAGARTAGRTYTNHVLSSPTTLALVAEVEGRLVALATAEPMTSDVSEVAFLVADDQQGRGLGTLLLEHLAAAACDRGVRQFEARVLRGNHRMIEVLVAAGFALERRDEDGEQVLSLDTVVTPATQRAVDHREFAAERSSLEPLFRPRGVVVYGVRRDGTGIGASVLSAITSGGYDGMVAAVHPTAKDVQGTPSYRSAQDAPGPVDLAVIAVPAAAVVAAFEDAAGAGARAAVVVSSGFRELGPRGAELQQDLAVAARRHGVRLVGPNGLGVINTDPEIRLHATFGGVVPPPGGLAVASQSGGVGIALMDLLAAAGVGISRFVSLGNKADVSGNDLLAAWYDDDRVKCAALYLESFGNPRKFVRFARSFSERKPLIAVVGGRSLGGRRAGASHTAAAASPAAGVSAVFAQAGVIACKDAEELADTAAMLEREPLPEGNRVAVISNAGGLGVLGADLAADERLDVTEFSGELRRRITDGVQQTSGTGNPVDAGAGADAVQLASVTAEVMDSGEVDAVVVVLVATGTNDLAATLDRLADVRRDRPARPLLVVPVAAPTLQSDDVTLLRSTAAAMGALGRIVRYAQWRDVERQDAPTTDPADVRRSRAVARALLDTAASGWVHPAAASALLAAYGIDLEGRFAFGADEAVRVASEIGYPVAAKVGDPEVVHRTERDLVRTGLSSPDRVHQAVDDLERAFAGPCTVLVQPMVAGVEMALGVVRDPSFGPLVMVGAGGTATDVWDDRAFLVPPFHESDVERVLCSLRIWPLLAGFRGARPAAVDDLARLVTRLGRLAVDVPEVAEIDLNPVMVGSGRSVVVDAKLRLAAAAASSTDLPRQLRPPG